MTPDFRKAAMELRERLFKELDFDMRKCPQWGIDKYERELAEEIGKGRKDKEPQYLLVKCAQILLSCKDIDLAEKWLDKALAHDPRNVPALYIMAYCKEHREDLMGTEKWFRKVSAIEPDNPKPILKIAKLKLAEKDFFGAKEVLLEVMEFDLAPHPELTSALYMLARCEATLKNYKAAEEYLLERQEIIPEDILTITFIAKIKTLLGEHKEALSLYRGILEKYPEETTTLHTEARRMIEEQEYDDAKLYLEVILKFNPDSAPAMGMMATCEMALGNHKETLNIYRTLLITGPHKIGLLYTEAKRLIREQEYDNAELYLEVILEFNPDSPPAMGMMATCKREKGDLDGERYWLKRTNDANNRNGHDSVHP